MWQHSSRGGRLARQDCKYQLQLPSVVIPVEKAFPTDVPFSATGYWGFRGKISNVDETMSQNI